jgi:hypothetical protein
MAYLNRVEDLDIDDLPDQLREKLYDLLTGGITLDQFYLYAQLAWPACAECDEPIDPEGDDDLCQAHQLQADGPDPDDARDQYLDKLADQTELAPLDDIPGDRSELY